MSIKVIISHHITSEKVLRSKEVVDVVAAGLYIL